MLRRERLHAVEREEQLEVHRLLAPERAVVVEGGDALGRRHEVGRAFLRHLLDKLDDGFLRRGVVPRRQRVLGLERSKSKEQKRSEKLHDRIPSREFFLPRIRHHFPLGRNSSPRVQVCLRIFSKI